MRLLNDVTLTQGDYQGQGHILYLVQLYTVEANKSIYFTIFQSVLHGLQYIYTKNIVIIMAYQCHDFIQSYKIKLTRPLTISSSFRRANMACSLLVTRSSRYWYLSFFLVRHSRALCRLFSSLTLWSTLAGRRPGRRAAFWRSLVMLILYCWKAIKKTKLECAIF